MFASVIFTLSTVTVVIIACLKNQDWGVRLSQTKTKCGECGACFKILSKTFVSRFCISVEYNRYVVK